MIPKSRAVKGTCWFVNLGDEPENGDVLYKVRPCIVVSANEFNRHSDCLTVVPITSRRNRKRKTHTIIETDKIKGIAKAEQMRTISKNQLQSFVCKMDADVMQKVAKSIAYHLFDDDMTVDNTDDNVVLTIKKRTTK